MPPVGEVPRIGAEYERLCDRYWRWLIYFIGTFAAAFALSLAKESVQSTLWVIAATLLFVGAIVVWLKALFAWFPSPPGAARNAKSDFPPTGGQPGLATNVSAAVWMLDTTDAALPAPPRLCEKLRT